ncbi:MAG: MerR family transcriptional regulator, partial [Nevskiales bacterium]
QGKSTLKERQEMLRAHRVRVRETIADWTRALKLIDGKIDFYGEWIATGHRPREKPKLRPGTSAMRTRRASRAA